MGASYSAANIAAVSAGTTKATGNTLVLSNSNGVSFGVNGNTVTASHAINVSAGATSNNLSALTFSNSNGVSFGISASTVTASVAAQTNQTLGLYAVGNTTQNSSTTLDARTVSYNGLGAATMGFSNGSVQVSVPNTSSISATGGLSISSNGSTISIGAGYDTLYSYEPYPLNNSNTTLLSANTATSGAATFIPFQLVNYVAAGWLNVVQSMNTVTAGTSKGSQTITVSYGLYSRGTGANSTTLSVITSGSYSLGVSYSNSSWTFNQPTTSNNTGYGTATAGVSGTGSASQFTGFKLVQFPLNSTMSPGQYWLGLFVAASTSSVNAGISQSFVGYALSTAVVAGLAPIGSFSSAFTGTNIPGGLGGHWHLGMGSYTSAAQTNLPGSVALSGITQSNASGLPYMRFVSTQ